MSRSPRRSSGPRAEVPVANFARFDAGREVRTGVPEVVLGEGKSEAHLFAIVAELRRRRRTVLVSRPSRSQLARFRTMANNGGSAEILADGRLVRVGVGRRIESRLGPVALLTAGTADVPIAEESAALLGALGVPVVRAYDVGVAGLHRLQRALARLRPQRPQVYLVFAGREGALPTVVAGLVSAPVVGVPTSVGYGRGGRGEASLNAMLQSCAPIAVVNIDGGVPAALFAAQLVRSAVR